MTFYRLRDFKRVFIAFLAFLAISGCAEKKKMPNIILFSMDTLRADTIGFFDYPKPTTPSMDRFLSECVVFKKAYAPEPHTLPSHVSLFTSLHPLSHGVKGLMKGGIALSNGIPTLAAVLRENGYTTAAFINGGFLHSRFGLDRGFDEYNYFSDIKKNEKNVTSYHGRSAEEVNEAVLAWLERNDKEPFFLFVHYFDIHSDWDQLPYDSPVDYMEMFCGDYQGDFNGGDGKKSASMYLEKVNRKRIALDPSTMQYIRSLYDAGVRYTDDQFGELIEELKRRKLFDRGLMVLLSDHGEEFKEHDKMLHTQLYEECLHVPLAFRFPDSDGVPPTEIHEPVRLIDVMPTLLEYVGLEPPSTVQGRSLWPIGRDRPAERKEEPFFFFSSITGDQAMIDSGWKLILSPSKKGVRLYDLQSDHMEKKDQAGSEGKRVSQYMKKMKAWRQGIPKLYRSGDVKTISLDGETIKQLQSFGYIK